MHIGKATYDLSKTKYDADDVHGLQERLEPIDEQYKEGIFDDRDRVNSSDDPYEHLGQGEVAHELDRLHEQHHYMLESLE
ncbi:hypothetical protein O0I10_008166 [Lichtheimia ornata]|uniref:Uncharacterized protein n=1 Tax=Lichtheimia ornata TaxID=688661 RepID=A0AAD7XX36_9FUNG|nr:uncharacterized protein O0I10_008166 [Lichtheimia ornata]KAJ8656153.1 hypothetical protein O0I10_008166 [Lichtheimia ornata]